MSNLSKALKLYRPAPGDTTVRVRFAPTGARFVREISQPSELQEKTDGGVERSVRTDSMRWVVDWSLTYGDQSEIVGPPTARKEARQVLDDWLEFYKKNTK